MNLLEITIGKKRETANRVKYNLANSRNRQKWRDQFPDFLKAEKIVDNVEMSRFKKNARKTRQKAEQKTHCAAKEFNWSTLTL